MGRVLPAPVAAELVARHRKEGVELRFDARAEAIEPGRVVLADSKTLEADLVIAAIGVTPETRLAEKAGLACMNGTLVDAGLRTADGSIFAAGNCAAIDPLPTMAAFASRPGAMPATRARSRRAPCWATRSRFQSIPGSGRISTISSCKWWDCTTPRGL